MKHVDYQAFNKDIVMGLVIGQESGGCLVIYAISLVTKRMMKPVRKKMIVARNTMVIVPMVKKKTAPQQGAARKITIRLLTKKHR